MVPLLGGHHGANDLARDIATLCETSAAITTSGDVHFDVALDQPPQDYVLANPADAKGFMAGLLQGESVQIEGASAWLETSKLPIKADGSLKITITNKSLEGSESLSLIHISGPRDQRGSRIPSSA